MQKMLTFIFLVVIVNIATATTLDKFKAAAVEYNPQFAQFKNNLPKLSNAVIDAAKHGAKLIVLPETATSGYIYKDRSQINPYLDTIPGITTNLLAKITKQYKVYVAIGIAEIDPKTNLAYNSAALIGPEGYIGRYRKTQLNSSDTKWATRGNLSYPIFQTKIGKIGLLICYDDMHLQTMLLTNLRGADILAYITASDVLPKSEAGSNNNHSTIGNISTMSGWLGMYIVASNRINNETNPLTGQITHFVGAGSIWDPFGKPLAIAPVSTWEQIDKPVTIYAEIDPKFYTNEIKSNWLTNRRPELYQDYNLFKVPTDPNASTKRYQINALLLQYQPIEGNKSTNYAKIEQLVSNNSSLFNLMVLPFNSLVGENINAKNYKQYAESLTGNSVAKMSRLAKRYKTYVVFSMPEQYNNHYYETAILIDPDGRITGIYRKTHLNATEKQWATAGNNLPVMSTQIGRVAIILNDETRIPELTDIYGLKRADILVIPTAYDGVYGGKIEIPEKLLVSQYPKSSMFIWYNMAKYAQAYVLVANYIGGVKKDLGWSSMYSLDPEVGFYPPLVANDQEQAFDVNFITSIDSSLWQNQERLISGRRDDLAVPLTLNMNSPCFKQWQKNETDKGLCD